MPIGSASVANYANVTSGQATDVNAVGGIGGAGEVVLYSSSVVSAAIITEAGFYLLTEDGKHISL